MKENEENNRRCYAQEKVNFCGLKPNKNFKSLMRNAL